MNKPARRIVFLDLDGTLTKSDAGIIASVKRALADLNVPIPDDQEMLRFVGPSIMESFERIGLDESLRERGLALYRHYYSEEAVFEDPHNHGALITGSLMNALYDGIDSQLVQLRERGYILAIATCKPEYQTLPICDYFALSGLVDVICGASRDLSRTRKDQVLQYALDKLDFTPSCDRALMVGDRWTDVDGALHCSLDCLGCGWGYAEPGELTQHGAYRVIDHVAQLADAVDEYFARPQ